MLIDSEFLPPLNIAEENFEFIEFDYQANRYLIPQYPPDCINNLISEQDIKCFIEKANDILARSENTDNSSKRDFKVALFSIGFITFLVGLFIVSALLANKSSYSSLLAAIGVLLVYVGSIILMIVILLIRRTSWFLGSFDYSTQKIRRLINEVQQKNRNLPIQWRLGTRVGGQNRRVETYDLLYLVWPKKDDTNANDKIV